MAVPARLPASSHAFRDSIPPGPFRSSIWYPSLVRYQGASLQAFSGGQESLSSGLYGISFQEQAPITLHRSMEASKDDPISTPSFT